MKISRMHIVVSCSQPDSNYSNYGQLHCFLSNTMRPYLRSLTHLGLSNTESIYVTSAVSSVLQMIAFVREIIYLITDVVKSK